MTETAAAGKGNHFVIRAAQGALVAPIVAILLSYAVQYAPSEFQLGLVWVKRLLLVMGFAAGAYALANQKKSGGADIRLQAGMGIVLNLALLASDGWNFYQQWEASHALVGKWVVDVDGGKFPKDTALKLNEDDTFEMDEPGGSMVLQGQWVLANSQLGLKINKAAPAYKEQEGKIGGWKITSETESTLVLSNDKVTATFTRGK